MDAGLNLKELAVMLVVSVVLLSLVTKVPPLIGNLAMGGGTGSLGSGFGLGTAIGAAALGGFALRKGADLVTGGAASVAGGAQAIVAAASLASENVAAGTDIVSRMAGTVGGNNSGGSSGSGGTSTPLASAMEGAGDSSISSLSSVTNNGSGTRNGSPRRGAPAVAAGKIAVDAAAILGKTAGKIAADKVTNVVQGAVQAVQGRIDATVGGRMAANIKAQGAPVPATSQFAEDSLSRAEPTPLNTGSAVATSSETVAAAAGAGEEIHMSTFEETTQSRADETSADPESEVAAFRDRDKKST
jgi:type IV secretion system protein VirB6/type IV secretion system protein TrbL